MGNIGLGGWFLRHGTCWRRRERLSNGHLECYKPGIRKKGNVSLWFGRQYLLGSGRVRGVEPLQRINLQSLSSSEMTLYGQDGKFYVVMPACGGFPYVLVHFYPTGY